MIACIEMERRCGCWNGLARYGDSPLNSYLHLIQAGIKLPTRV
jgi:hypothetical protein